MGHHRRPGPPSRGTGSDPVPSRLFWLTIGLAAGVFVSSLAIPALQPEATLTISAGTAPGAPPARPTGAPDAATPGPDDIISGSSTDASSRVPGATTTASAAVERSAPGPDAGAPSPGPTANPREEPAGGTEPGATANEEETSEPIRIGIGVPELGALASLGPSFDFGDVGDHFRAIHEDWTERGLIPIDGREVVFHYRSYSLLSADEQRAACVGWADDDHVTAVIALQYFFATDCLPAEKRIPLLMDTGLAPRLMERSNPYLFTLSSDYGHLGRNWIHWAHRRGIISGKRLGLYSDESDTDGIATDVRETLSLLGYDLVEDVTTTEAVTGGPQDNVAAQRFAANDVEVAILAVSSLAQTNFMHSAEASGYRPTYIGGDFFSGSTDTATETYPAAHYDGTFGMTTYRHGELSSGIAPPREQVECLDRYGRHSGRSVTHADRPAEWFVLTSGCDTAAVLLEGLQRATRPITKDSYVAGLEQIRDKPLGVTSNVTFTPLDHSGSQWQRTIQFHADCVCWKVVDDFAPWFVE